jgi:hypothetical protein
MNLRTIVKRYATTKSKPDKESYFRIQTSINLKIFCNFTVYDFNLIETICEIFVIIVHYIRLLVFTILQEVVNFGISLNDSKLQQVSI